MSFDGLDHGAVARLLAQIADQEGDLADAFFERSSEVELPPEDDAASPRIRCEEGFAVRLARGGRTWLASRDGMSATAFVEALRQVARAQPRAALVEPAMPPPQGPPEAALEPLRDFRRRVETAIRAEHVAFPLRLRLRQHRRDVQVVGTRLIPEAAREEFTSVIAETPWGQCGDLFCPLDAGAAGGLAQRLAQRFRARFAPSPPAGVTDVVLAPAAAAVFLHEAVAHALEADLLALTGNPESAIGLELGSSLLHVLDDPAAAPQGVRRACDDEGVPVVRRWLLRAGVVEQPIADLSWSASSSVLAPGAGRRGRRHSAPSPRSSFLELLPGESGESDLRLGRGGIVIFEAERGTLDPLTGVFTLEVAYGQVPKSERGDGMVGPFRLRGRVAALLGSVVAIGRDANPGGAGWCAKGGARLAVWAKTPSLRVEGVEVLPP